MLFFVVAYSLEQSNTISNLLRWLLAMVALASLVAQDGAISPGSGSGGCSTPLPLFLSDCLNVADSEDLSTGTRTPPGVFFSERDVWSSFERKATVKAIDLKAKPLSCGSVGHPHACAAPCRYVKKHGGCRDGASCQKCHLCFWQRKPDAEELLAKKVTSDDQILPCQSESQDEIPSDSIHALPTSAAAASVGTKGHPFNCGSACKYFRRKGGCRDGAACQNCHECRWRRDVSDDQGEGPGLCKATGPGFDKESSKTLQRLIYWSLCSPCDIDEQNKSPLETPLQVGPSQVFASSDFVKPPPGLPAKISVTNEMEDALRGPSSMESSVDLCKSIGSIGHPYSCGLACKYAGRPSGCKDGRMCSRCHCCRWQRKQESLPQNKMVAPALASAGPPPGLF